jgi:DNA-binding GntR family transcriptional regulator
MSTVGASGVELTTAGRIARDLQARIFTGDLAVGSPLREVELVEYHRTSRHTVREALRELVSAGLVVQDPRRSARVRELTRDDIRDLFGLRRVLELEALRRMVDGDAPVQPLLDAVDAREAAEEGTDGSRYTPAEMDADLAFHRAIVTAAGSPRLARAFETVAGELRLAFLALGQESSDRGDHRAILQAVLARDVDHATELLDTHIRDGLRICLAAAHH